jgi:hypothetical protein
MCSYTKDNKDHLLKEYEDRLKVKRVGVSELNIVDKLNMTIDVLKDMVKELEVEVNLRNE